MKGNGIVYKIENKNTGKTYIGATINTLEKRVKDHLMASRTKKRKLYLDFREETLSDFEIEVLEEGVGYDILPKKEKEYIEKYNSILEGYNEHSGGQSVNYKTISIEEDIISVYHELKSCRKTAERFQIDKDTVSEVIKRNNLTLYDASDRIGVKTTVILDDGTELFFKSKKDCAKFLVENGFSNSSVEHLRKVLSGRKFSGIKEIVS